MATRGMHVWGVDVSAVAVELARDLATRFTTAARCRFDIVDLDDGLPDGPKLDVIHCHLYRDARLDAAVTRRLAPGGLLAIAVLSEVGHGPGPFRARAGELRAAFGRADGPRGGRRGRDGLVTGPARNLIPGVGRPGSATTSHHGGGLPSRLAARVWSHSHTTQRVAEHRAGELEGGNQPGPSWRGHRPNRGRTHPTPCSRPPREATATRSEPFGRRMGVRIEGRSTIPGVSRPPTDGNLLRIHGVAHDEVFRRRIGGLARKQVDGQIERPPPRVHRRRPAAVGGRNAASTRAAWVAAAK